MKKYTLLFIVFTLLLSVRVGFSQTCDCETLQTQIDDLNNRFDLLQPSITKTIEPTDYHQYIDIDKDYRIKFVDDNSKISIMKVGLNTTTGETIEQSSFLITFFFNNISPFNTKFNEKVFIRAYQNEIRLLKDFKNTKDNKTIPSYLTESIAISFILVNEIDDVTLEICEILPNNQLNHVATWVIPLSDAIRE